jgi:uncharacterized membrane protein
MRLADSDSVPNKARAILAYLDGVVRDDRLRSDVGSAVGHGLVVAKRSRKDSNLSDLGDRLASDAKFRRNVRDLLHDLDSAGERMRRKRGHRVRKVVFAALAAIAGALAVRPLLGWLSRQEAGSAGSGLATVNQSVDVNVPVSAAYNQWTQFEDFPRFMEGVDEVRQLDDTLLHWAATVSGRRREWDAKITEQSPDRRIAWKSVSGAETSGAVTFEPAGADRTRVNVSMSYRPATVDRLGSLIGLDNRRVRGDLRRFKELIEGRGAETGAWRGEVHGGTRTS